MANNIVPGSIVLGWFPSSINSNTLSTDLNNADNWLAFSFVAESTTNVSQASIYIVTKTGTLAATDVSCTLYSDANGVPGSTVEARTSTDIAIASAKRVTWTGFTSTAAITSGKRYWMVWKNLNGSPNLNYPTMQYGHQNTLGNPQGGYDTSGSNSGKSWEKVLSTNGGVSYAGAIDCPAGLEILCADNLVLGMAIDSVGVDAAKAQTTAETGVRFTMPTGANFNVIGAGMGIQGIGGLTGNVAFKLWTGSTPTLLATATTQPGAQLDAQSFGYTNLLFTSSQAVNAGTVVTLTMALTGGNSDASHYLRTYQETINNTTQSKAQKPFGGTYNYYTYDGATWTNDATLLIPAYLLLVPQDSTGAGPL